MFKVSDDYFCSCFLILITFLIFHSPQLLGTPKAIKHRVKGWNFHCTLCKEKKWDVLGLRITLAKTEIIYPKNVGAQVAKRQCKAEFKNLDDFEVLSSDFSGSETSTASLTSAASTTSVALMTASFHQKNTLPDGWIISMTKMTNTIFFLRNR